MYWLDAAEMILASERHLYAVPILPSAYVDLTLYKLMLDARRTLRQHT